MKVNKSYKTRVYPTVRQQRMLAEHFGCARWVYNHFLQDKNDEYKETGKSKTFVAMSKELTRLKTAEEFKWLGNVSRQCISNAVRNLDVAFNNFFNKKAKHPKFKKKHNKQSFRTGAPFTSVRTRGVHIPLIGVLKCHLNMPQEYHLLSSTVSKEPTGKYFVSVNFETEIKDKKPSKKKPIVGLDFGIKTFITDNNGNKIEHPKPMKKWFGKLKREQRSLSRKVKGSNRRNKQRVRVALVHEKIRNLRSDFLHKLSRKLIDENQAIYVENLNLEGMKQRFGVQISDLGWGEFIRQLSYKGVWYGCDVFKIERFFPSSKTCFKCNKINKDLTLSDREWVCECGEKHDRDINAAKNILTYGRADRNLRSQRTTAFDEARSARS